MPSAGAYLYGFTHHTYRPSPDLRGLGDAAVRAVAFGDLAAVVSDHPVQPLMPSRRNVEPHHRIVGRISGEAPLVPAAFGHIGDSDTQILEVVRANYDEIRTELGRLAGLCEMELKLRWRIDNIFDVIVRRDRELRELRDRVFRQRQPSFNDKLKVGALFEAALGRERERLGRILLAEFDRFAREIIRTPPAQETLVCQAMLLVERARGEEFRALLADAAGKFDETFILESTGPWPPYSFVRLRLQAPERTAA